MPEFRANCCTRYRYRYSECRRCVEACPHEAIDLSDAGASLVVDRCRDCGLCISACRTGAWSTADFKPIELLREAIKKPTWSVACVPSGCEADATVPCLGAMDAAWLAYMARRGIPVSLKGSGHCGECAHGDRGSAQLQLNLDAVDALHRASGARDTDAVSRGWSMPVLAPDREGSTQRKVRGEASRHSPDRRGFFRRVFRSGEKQAESLATARSTNKQAIRAGAYVLPEQRELLQIVCNFKSDKPCVTTLHDGLPLMQLTLQTGCTLCEACFRVCPTGALQIVEDPDNWALTFLTDRCVACEVCLEVCQPRVLDAAASFDLRAEQPAVTLISRTKQRCSRCDRHFASPSPETTCVVCRDDEDAFDAIFG